MMIVGQDSTTINALAWQWDGDAETFDVLFSGDWPFQLAGVREVGKYEEGWWLSRLAVQVGNGQTDKQNDNRQIKPKHGVGPFLRQYRQSFSQRTTLPTASQSTKITR